MSLTPEERKAINRQNAQKSTGPRTEAGKKRSRRNAYKHGFRCEILALSGEDGAAVERLADEWYDFYKPQSPAERELLEMAVTASVQRKRIVRAKTAVVAQQVRVAEFNFDQHFRDQIQAVVGQLEDDPGNVVHRYRASAAGCRWLIGRWERLSQMLEKDQTLLGHDRHEAIQLQGYLHFTDTLMYAEQAYLTFMHCYIAQHNHNKKYMKLLLSKYRIPNTFRARGRKSWMPTVEQCKPWLRNLIDTNIAELRERELTLRLTIEQPRAMKPRSEPSCREEKTVPTFSGMNGCTSCRSTRR